MKQNPTIKTSTVDFYAYVVQEREDQKTTWDRIGIAFQHKDGKGLNLIMRANSVDGRITLRVPSEHEKSDE